MQSLQTGTRKTEYLVVGAGAAGCTLGYLLKKAGADVLLLEMQNDRQRFKLCAGILENRAVSAFCDIFGETVEEAGLAPMSIENVCALSGGYEFKRVMPGCSSVTREVEESGSQLQKSLKDSLRGYLRTGGKALAKKMILEALGFDLASDFNFRALPRKRLDDYIRDRYLAEGGEIRYQAKVLSIKEEDGLAECIDLVTKERFAVRFQCIIGADGAMSSVRRLLTGRQQRVYLALEAAVPLVRRDSVSSLIQGGLGYCWYVPRGEDATVGCGYHNPGTRAYEICRQRLTAFCADLGMAVPHRFYGAFIPEGDDVLLRPGKRSYLIGDAAGLNDAFTGGGIHYALLSAQALAGSSSGSVSYEEAMKPHLAFIKRNSNNVGLYYRVACSVVERFGNRRG